MVKGHGEAAVGLLVPKEEVDVKHKHKVVGKCVVKAKGMGCASASGRSDKDQEWLDRATRKLNYRNMQRHHTALAIIRSWSLLAWCD